MDWLLYALLSAFSLASADAFTKWRLSDYSMDDLMFLRFAVPGILLAPILFFHPLPHVPPVFWGWVFCAVPLEIAAMLFYMRAIRASPLYLTMPYLAFTPAFSALAGYVLLGEKIASTGLAGIALITLGAFLLNIRHMGKGIFEPFRAILDEPGSRWMLLVSVIYGLTSVMGKGALKYCPPLAFGALYYLVLGIVSILFFSRPSVRTLSGRPIWALAVGAMVSVMVVSHFMALDLSQVAYMIAVKRTSLLFGIAYGAILFRERGFRMHFLAGLIMISGVALVSFR
ncbi:MAG: DMT family transporter [Burkholderiales bacterium]|nr:DMT family transporter [Burkholderiales bacterium]